MRPGQVLDMQADLLDRFTHNSEFFRYVQGTIALKVNGKQLQKRQYDTAANLVQAMRGHVARADAYRVTPDMTTMVEHIASTLDSTAKFNRRLAPSECGIVRFDKPLPINDARGRTMLAHWLLWGSVNIQFAGPGATNLKGGPTTLSIWFNDHAEPDTIGQEIIAKAPPETLSKMVGRWGVIGIDVPEPGTVVGDDCHPLHDDAAARILAEGDTPHPFTNTLRYIHALWLLMGQTITTVEPEHLDRATSRRAKRMKIPDRVSIIRLRSRAHRQQPGETLVEWSHRWIVKGHMRWQPYGTRRVDHTHVYSDYEDVVGGHLTRHCTIPGCDAHLDHIYIHPYEKGPEDKPLVQTRKVYSLER